MPNAFTYQGQLSKFNQPVSETCSFEFFLWDAEVAGEFIAGPAIYDDVVVQAGLFTVDVDFGPRVLNGYARYLEVKTKCGSETNYTSLSPRVPLMPVPYAMALPGLWTEQNTISPNVVGGYRGNTVFPGAAGATISGGGEMAKVNTVVSSFGAIGGGRSNLANGEHCTVGGGERNSCFGTSSVVGGGQGNSVNGITATIAGGNENRARARGATVPGGSFNVAGGADSLAGGFRAKVRDGDDGTFVWADQTGADFTSTGPNQFIIRAAGGVGIGTNEPTRQLEVRDFPDVEIGLKPEHPNGRLWTIQSSNPEYGGQISESFQIIDRKAGVSRLLIDTQGQIGIGTSAPRGALEVAGGPLIVAPPTGNSCCLEQPQTYCLPESCMSAVCAISPECCDGGQSGWDDRCVQLAHDYCGSLCTHGVGIGTSTPKAPLDVAGGADSNGANDPGGLALSWQGGGYRHFIASRHNSASTADNTVDIWVNRSSSADGSLRPGTGNARMLSLTGDGRVNLDRNNTTSAADSTVGGGNQNIASAIFSTIAGGQANEAPGPWSTVGGGSGNFSEGWQSTIGGGWVNDAPGDFSTVGGGEDNSASGTHSMVGGGTTNIASGVSATVPGGNGNTASGDFSFAAGRHALALTTGHFRWGDSRSGDCNHFSGPNDSFWVTAHGGVRFETNVQWIGNPNPCTAQAFWTGVELAPGGSGWSAISDRNVKENFAEVNKTELLQRLAEIPVSTWNLKSQDPSIRHIGPMAQDFRDAFGLGESERTINTLDADGVAFAAIQGLNELVKEKECRIEDLEEKNRQLEARLSAIERLLNSNGGVR